MTERPVGDHSEKGKRKLKPDDPSLLGELFMQGPGLALECEEDANTSPQP